MFSNIFWPQKVFSFFRNHISFQIYFGLKKVFEIIIPIPKGIKIPLRRENHCVLCKLSTMVIFSSFIKHTCFQKGISNNNTNTKRCQNTSSQRESLCLVQTIGNGDFLWLGGIFTIPSVICHSILVNLSFPKTLWVLVLLEIIQNIFGYYSID